MKLRYITNYLIDLPIANCSNFTDPGKAIGRAKPRARR